MHSSLIWKKNVEWHFENLTFIVRERDKRRIRKIEIIKQDHHDQMETVENS